jgi:hypothetical protein
MGQEYDYKDLDGTSSGVATFEPNGSMENPFVLPFYDKSPQGINSKMLAPKEMNYVEKPIGESFFPSPTITYGRVVVSNISREGLTKHATGKVVNEFYTSYDFPTITKQSLISIKQDKKNAFSQILNIKVRNHITAAQGFVVETNDMNGKPKSQWVYAEGQPQPISGVEYKYFTDSYGKLINEMDVVDNDGNVSKKNIGLTNDIINDFRQSKSSTTIMGINANVSSFFAFVGVLVIPLLLPTGAYHEDQLRMSTTTKIVHRQGILKETIAYDLGSHVSTQNLAFDSDTGQVIVTKTHNEYDQYYYSINYPAHWYDGYKTMGSASNNIDLEGTLSSNEELTYFSLGEASPTNQYLTLGDEINTFLEDGSYYKKLWVVHFDETNPDKVKLMDREGRIVNDCPENETINRLKFKVVRSGFRNVQSAMMASIVTQSNPFVNNKLRDFTFDPLINISQNPKIINASAIEYSDYWKSQCENNLPNFQERPGMFNEETNELDESIFYNLIENYNINPFLFNIRGDWRAKKSYAFLTGRSQSINLQGSPTTSIDGFLTSFNPFYRFENNVWSINRQNWTNASTVTQFSPYGAELENKDALNRYSSAQYGFGYSLPTAVASNTAYKQLGFESFEDIENGSNEYKNSHFSFQDPLVNNSMTALISEKESHTGKKSVMVKPGKSLTYINKFSNCVPVVIDDCVSDIITQPSNSLNIVYSEISSECFYSNSSGATITGGTPNKPLMFHLQYGADHPCAIVTCNVSINGIDFTYQNSNSNVNIPFTLDSEGEAQILVQITEAYCSYAGTNGIEEIRINVDYQIENEDYKQFTYCFNSDH